MANLPSWVAPMMKPTQGLQNVAQVYTQPMQHMPQPKVGGWDGQGPNPMQPQPMQHSQQGLQGLESRIPPDLMQLLQPFMNGQNGGAMNGMKGLLGFQPIEHNPFTQQQPGGGGLYGG